MKNLPKLAVFRRISVHVCVLSIGLAATGCGPHYRQFRQSGQTHMDNAEFGAAKLLFLDAEDDSPRHLENLADLGACSIMLARARFSEMNHAAALREVDDALTYYSRALDVSPGHQLSVEGKNIALELKGQFDEALAHAEWTAEFVGPQAKYYLFLASELEERGDMDAALLRYRQAVAMEPENVDSHIAFAKFLARHGIEPATVHHLKIAYRLDPLNEWVMDELARRGQLPPLMPAGQQLP